MGGVSDRRVRVLQLVLDQARLDLDLDHDLTPRWLRSVCRAAVPAIPVAGATVVVSGGSEVLAVGAASDDEARAHGERQVALGEGPAFEALRRGVPVLEPDLSVDAATRRWPVFAPAALDRGVAAAYVFPLRVGVAQLGVLDLYRRDAGMLDGEGIATALSLADIAVDLLLDQQARAGAGGTVTEIEDVLEHDAVVHQAQGMVMVDLAVSIQDASSLLRAFAFARGQSVADVARQVVEGGLRLPGQEP